MQQGNFRISLHTRITFVIAVVFINVLKCLHPCWHAGLYLFQFVLKFISSNHLWFGVNKKKNSSNAPQIWKYHSNIVSEEEMKIYKYLPAVRKNKDMRWGEKKWAKNPTRHSQNSKADVRRAEKFLEKNKVESFLFHYLTLNNILTVKLQLIIIRFISSKCIILIACSEKYHHKN